MSQNRLRLVLVVILIWSILALAVVDLNEGSRFLLFGVAGISGYHILYVLQDWERFKHIPLNVLTHSTHLCGSGILKNDIEKHNVKLTLAIKIPVENCAHLNPDYIDSATLNITEW